MPPVVPRIVNSVSYVTRISHDSIMTVILRGRRSIWRVWTMTLVAPRIVNSVSCVTRINDECYFAWQAQYLVSLDNDTCYSAHCK